MAQHNLTGKMGEEYAADQLEKCGYTILCRNFSVYYGEIDVIAAKGDIIAFVEVRTRSLRSGIPSETVTKTKRKRIISAAYIYMEKYPTKLQPRFDIISVITDTSGKTVKDWRHLKGAFDGSDYDGSF